MARLGSNKSKGKGKQSTPEEDNHDLEVAQERLKDAKYVSLDELEAMLDLQNKREQMITFNRGLDDEFVRDREVLDAPEAKPEDGR